MAQNAILTRRVSYEEVKSAIFSMLPNKSPGLDRFSMGFYQVYWDIMELDIVKLCDEVM